MALNAKTLSALQKLNYVEPTEVQEKVIPRIIGGKNMLIRSQTGTGKTAAFGIGIIERITRGLSKKALIMAPTRELAVQICKELRGIGQDHHMKIHVVYGGQSINVQMDDLRHGVDILVATPGRLLDLSRRGVVHIGEFNIAILDEADQMLDMGFLDEVTAILDQLPQARMTLLVSATLDENIMSIASKYVPSPDTIEVGEIEVAATISQEHIEATEREKFPRLLEVLRSHENMKILIFRETKKGAARLQQRLWERGCKCGVLEGDMSQAQRNMTLANFKEGQIKVLVATNVAARGLHIDDLGLIINYDKAQSEEIHLHRIGRTGRMGQAGKAINFVVRKESLDERMSSDHPDLAWMKQGGTDFYRQGRGWGPGGGSGGHEGRGHGERPRYGDRGHGRGGSRYGERSHGGGHGGSHYGGPAHSREGAREHGGGRHRRRPHY